MVSNPFRTVGPKDENGDPKWVKIAGVPGKIGPSGPSRTNAEIASDVRNGNKDRCIFVQRGKRCEKQQISGNYMCRKHQGS